MLEEQNYRALWSQVVLQAKQDLESEQPGSILYGQAELFFSEPVSGPRRARRSR